MRKPYYWKARKAWYFRYRDDTGKLRGMPLGKTKKEAYDKWKAITADLQEASSAGWSAVDVIEFYSLALESRLSLKEIESSTVTRQIDYLASFCTAIGPAVQASELKPYHVTEWLDGKKRWNTTTRFHAARTVKSAFTWAVKQGRIPKNPIALLNVPKGEARDFTVSDDLYLAILDGASDPNYRKRFGKARRYVTAFKAVLIAMKLTGCRPGEICKVTIENFDGETWTIPEHKTKRKKRKPRVVYLHPCARTLTRILAGDRQAGPVFRPHESRPWKYSDLRRRFERLRQRKKITKECVLYSFRHTWITNAMVKTGDVATVAEMAGTSIQMIERHYGHLSKRREFLVNAAVRIASDD